MIAEATNNSIENLWMLTRQIEFANYKTAINAINGKALFKSVKQPTDLYVLPSDKKKKVEKQKKLIIPTREHAMGKILEAQNRK